MLLPTHLNLARYKFTFRVIKPLYLPTYAGSALRGVFGRALMQLSGLQDFDTEQKTPLFMLSPYAEIFEPQPSETNLGLLARLQSLPPLYIIQAPTNGQRVYEEYEEFSFHLVLLGKALEHLPLIILAWRRALLRGIGKDNAGIAELITVELADNPAASQVIYTEEKPLVAAHSQQLKLAQFNQAADMHLYLLTPLRIQQRGKILISRQLTPEIFFRNLIRRLSVIWQMQLNEAIDLDTIDQLNQLASQPINHQQRLSQREWARYSSRQQQRMQMDGVQGHWLLENIHPTLQQLTWVGQFLHLGKGTSFGLGGYEISQKAWRPNNSDNQA